MIEEEGKDNPIDKYCMRKRGERGKVGHVWKTPGNPILACHKMCVD